MTISYKIFGFLAVLFVFTVSALLYIFSDIDDESYIVEGKYFGKIASGRHGGFYLRIKLNNGKGLVNVIHESSDMFTVGDTISLVCKDSSIGGPICNVGP